MSDKIVVITGASGGIGAALAEILGNRGDSLVMVARRKEALEAAAVKAGGSVLTIVADVTRRDEVKRVVRDAIEHFGHVDVWVNNVGQGITRMPTELTDDDIDEMIRVNVKSALYGMQEILPHFRSRGTGQIINVSSMLGRLPYATMRSSYVGAKHFLNALTAMMREEVQNTHPDIQISLVSPGVVRTEFGINARHGGHDSRQIPNSQSAEEVAAVIAQQIDTRAPDLYTREGARERVAKYYESIGADPAGITAGQAL